MPFRPNNVHRHGILPVENVLPFLCTGRTEHEVFLLNGSIYRVKINSHRLRCFLNDGVVCRKCGIVASYFAVESYHNMPDRHHLALYALDDDKVEVELTHDHIIGRGFGGTDTIDNTQTLCYNCNNDKSRIESMIANAMRDGRPWLGWYEVLTAFQEECNESRR